MRSSRKISHSANMDFPGWMMRPGRRSPILILDRPIGCRPKSYLEEKVTQLKDNERLRRLYLAYVDDGILDIFVGWIIFLAGLMLFTEMFWMAGVYVAIFIPVLWSAKEQITLPRLRKEELRPLTTQKSFNTSTAMILSLVLVAILGVLVMVLLFGGQPSSTLKQAILYAAAGVISVAFLSGFVAAARSYRAPRWYGYGAMVVVFALLLAFLGIGLPWLLMAAGAIIALAGAIYLARFLRSHTILPMSERPVF